MQAVRDWKHQKERGNSKKLEDYPNFNPPYNDAWWAMAHISLPFNFERQSVKQGGGSTDDMVCKHPYVMAEGMSLDQYQSK